MIAAPIVFIDFAGPDDARLRAFYTDVFGWEFDSEGLVELHFPGSINGTVRQDPAEKRIYLGVPDVSEALHRVEAGGGTIDEPRFEVPGVVVLGLFRDPAGNPMGWSKWSATSARFPEPFVAVEVDPVLVPRLLQGRCF